MVNRIKTRYPGVYYREAKRAGGGKEAVYYIVFKKNGKTIEEKVGRKYQDDITPARAARIRSERIENRRKSRREIIEDRKKIKITIGYLWKYFYNGKSSNKTIKCDMYRWNCHLSKDFENRIPSSLVTSDIDKLKENLFDKKLAPATIKQVLSLLKRIINFAVTRGLCSPIPLNQLYFDMPKLNNIKTEDLSPNQLKKLIKVLDAETNKQAVNIMLMALYTGMRRGELFALKWENIDFHKKFILIMNPKSGTNQTIPLNQSAYNLLLKHERTNSLYVFPGLNGNKRKCIKKPLKRIKRNAGLPKNFRPLHGLRHVYASMLASSGKVDMYTLQKLLTHKSPQMTQRYAHLRDEALMKASNLVGDIMDNIWEKV